MPVCPIWRESEEGIKANNTLGPKNHRSLEEAVCSMMAAAQSAAVMGSAAVRGHDAANGF